MADWELIDFDPVVQRAMFGRDVQGGMELKTVYFVDNILDANKEQFNHTATGWAGDYHKIASISPALAYGDGFIAEAFKANDDKAISKWLNDSDNRAWRTKEGTV
jgi:hypothetical protein